MNSKSRIILLAITYLVCWLQFVSTFASNELLYDFSHVRQPQWGSHKELLSHLGVLTDWPMVNIDSATPRSIDRISRELDFYFSATRDLYSHLLGKDEDIERNGIQKNEELLSQPQQVLRMIYFVSWVSGWHEELSKSLDPLGLEELMREQRRKNFLKSVASGGWSAVENSVPHRDRSEVHDIQIRLKLLNLRLSDLKKHLKPYFLPSLNCIVALETARKK